MKAYGMRNSIFQHPMGGTITSTSVCVCVLLYYVVYFQYFLF